MSNLRRSKVCAWGAMIIVVAVLVCTFPLKTVWWTYFDVFFAFMMAFFHLMAVYMKRIPNISKTLDLWALVFGVLMIVSIIGIYIAESVMFKL